MSSGGGARKQAKKQAAEARRVRQDATEQEGRTRQKAERGTGGRSSRAVLMGNLSRPLSELMGAGG